MNEYMLIPQVQLDDPAAFAKCCNYAHRGIAIAEQDSQGDWLETLYKLPAYRQHNPYKDMEICVEN